MPRKKTSPEQRFWKKVEKTETCWNWTASTFPSGIGQFRVEGRPGGTAPRFSYELHYGPIDSEERVTQTCGNPACVNPEHLAVGPVARFWAKVDKNGPVHPRLGNCWQWTGAVAGDAKGHGYGNCIVDGHTRSAHRYAYEISLGPIPEGHDIDHICRNRLCVRPEHLRPATRKQNMENLGLSSTNRTGLRGVREWDGWFLVETRHNGRKYFGGAYQDINDAERAAVKLRNRLYTHNDDDRADPLSA